MTFGVDGFTGHQNGLIGHSASTGMRPSHPAAASASRPYSAGCGPQGPHPSLPAPAPHPQTAEHLLRLFVPCDDERAAAITRAHLFEHGVHEARFRTITNR